MHALRYHLNQADTYDLAIDDLPEPQPFAGEVRVRVAYCGICGSDLARYRQAMTPTRELKELLGGISFVPGHEISGTVDALGPKVPQFWSD